MIGVRAGDGAYTVAIAELPLRAHRADAVPGSIVVIGGTAGWAGRAARAAADGAAGIVVVAPRSSADTELTLDIPVVVQRPLLRPDVATDAAREVPPVHVQVEASASRTDFEMALRESIGWARTLGDAPLELLEARATARGLLVHLDLPATIVLARRESAPPWVRALAVGSTRTEVTIEASSGVPVVAHTDGRGRLEPRARYETAERVALRRILDALELDARPADLAEFEHDAQLAARALTRARAE